MKRVRMPVLLFILLLAAAPSGLAQWDEANSRGIFPYWQSGGNWFTLLVFVNGSEETTDILYLRFCDAHSGFPSDTNTDMHSIRHREQLVFSTSPSISLWVPVTGPSGFVMFRVEQSGFIQAYCVIFNYATGSGYTVPAYRQDQGF